MPNDVTFVLTSCGRQDLLEMTLDSFLQYNTFPISKYIITEDSGQPGINDHLKDKYAHLDITWIEDPQRRGQLPCIDDAYSRVTTPYIFHCEDDWDFFRPGFIETSLEVLRHMPPVLQVWLRAENDTNGHPLENTLQSLTTATAHVEFRAVTLGYRGVWNGFSFNPGLRRLSDYRLLGRYTPYGNEAGLSVAYSQLLYRSVILRGGGYVRHLGSGRHVEHP